LKKAVAEYSMTGGNLTLFTVSDSPFFPPDAQGMRGHVTREDIERFEQLLSAPEGSFHSLTAGQCETALAELIQNGALVSGSMLLQGVDISKWLIEGQPVDTQSRIYLYYGIKPCISTFLQFETAGQFEFIKRVLSDLNFCRLNEKHLKPIKRGLKKKSGEQDHA